MSEFSKDPQGELVDIYRSHRRAITNCKNFASSAGVVKTIGDLREGEGDISPSSADPERRAKMVLPREAGQPRNPKKRRKLRCHDASSRAGSASLAETDERTGDAAVWLFPEMRRGIEALVDSLVLEKVLTLRAVDGPKTAVKVKDLHAALARNSGKL